MAASFLSLLPKSARAAYPIIRRGHREGLSGREIERRVRQAGLPISRGRSIGPIMKALDALESQGRRVRFIPSAARINVQRLPPAITDIKKQYQYRMQLFNVSEGNLVSKGIVQYQTNNPNLTPQMVKDEMWDQMKASGEDYGVDDPRFVIEYGEQRAGIGDFTQTPRGEFLMQGTRSLGFGELLGEGGAGVTGTTPTI